MSATRFVYVFIMEGTVETNSRDFLERKVAVFPLEAARANASFSSSEWFLNSCERMLQSVEANVFL